MIDGEADEAGGFADVEFILQGSEVVGDRFGAEVQAFGGVLGGMAFGEMLEDDPFAWGEFGSVVSGVDLHGLEQEAAGSGAIVAFA